MSIFRRAIVLLCAGLLLFAAVPARGSQYPSPTGKLVSDFAGVIDAGTLENLERQLLEYERQTSIELAVVTVPTLEGADIESYANGLFRAWGIGKKDKNNGILFLVAVNDRAWRVEIGYGMEADLVDSAAYRLIHDHTVPLFKQKKMSEGIAAGVAAIIGHLGATPYEQRQAERAKAAEEQARATELRRQNMFAALTVCGAILAIVAPVFFVWWLIRKARREKAARMKAVAGAETALEKAQDFLERYRKSCPGAKAALATLNRCYSDEVGKEAERQFACCAEKAKSAEADIAGVKALPRKKKKQVAAFAAGAERARQSAFQLAEDVLAPEKAVALMERLKSESETLMNSIPAAIEQFKNIAAHNDVSEKTRKKIPAAEKRWERARNGAAHAGARPNWLMVAGVLKEAFQFAQTATNEAHEEIAYAKEARENGPKLLRKGIPEALAKAKSAIGHGDVRRATRDQYKKAEKDFEQAQAAAAASGLDWVVFYGILLAIFAAAEAATASAKKDVQRAQDERREEEERRRREEERRHRSSSGGFGGGSSGGGGFGGGSSGGGGASGRW